SALRLTRWAPRPLLLRRRTRMTSQSDRPITGPGRPGSTPPEDDARGERMQPVVRVDRVTKVYRARGTLFSRGRLLRAVDDVSLYVREGETLGLVGESGSGKTTLGRTALRLIEPTVGRILWDGEEVTHLSERKLRPLRRKMQITFQDPYASLDPRMTVGETLAEPIAIHKLYRGRSEVAARIANLLERVGLRPETSEKLP